MMLGLAFVGICFYTSLMTAAAPLRKRAIYTIPAGVSFANALVTGITDLSEDPADLACALVLVPSRRAARALRLAFLEAKGATAMLLPRMVTIGDVDDDDPALLGQDVRPHGPGAEASTPEFVALPPPINPLRRQLLLARLLEGFALGGQRPTFGQAMMLAKSLADLLDQVTTVGGDLAQLRDMLPERFSQHWQDILTLLNILIERWPDILAGEGASDRAARQEILARERLRAWQTTPPEGLVVIAGSTGTFATTRDLIACVADLPRGHVVLPGLDLAADLHWPDIELDVGHPQHQLAHLLIHLEMAPDEVKLWPGLAEDKPVTALRRDLMREVFAPAAQTTNWRQLAADKPELTATCLQGLEVVVCADMNSEAAVIALCLRETLETPEKTAALITPDRALAEAVIVALRRWHIHVDDSAGTPLSQCAAGGFLHLLANALAADFAPVPLLALLKHPLAACGMAQRDFGAQLRAVERSVLRGQRPGPGLAGVIDGLAGTPELADFIRQHVQAPLDDVIGFWHRGVPSLGHLAAALSTAAERLAARVMTPDGLCDAEDGALHLWDDFDGEAAAEVMRDLTIHAQNVGIDPAEFPRVLGQLFAEKPVRRRWPLHPRLSVLGPVEARMQSADRLVIAGFNEDNWPPKPESDPWMNGEMRAAVGMPPRNWRTGLSAHDVYMAVCAPEVIVTRSLRQADTATSPSRWLQRFETVIASLGLASALNRGEERLDWVPHLTPHHTAPPMVRPAPTPPVTARPRQFSATEVDSWISDPYSIYAKKILRLRQLDPLDRPPDAALRGTLVHDALALFIDKFPAGPLPEDALAELEAMGRKVFAAQWSNPGVQYFWWPRFMAVAGWFVSQEQHRRQSVQISHAEIKGSIKIEGLLGPMTFTARADRLDQDMDGGWHVIDYKTGSVPSAAQVASGRRTQLLIESLIAAQGGFDGLEGGAVQTMEYWQLSGRRDKIAIQTDVRPTDWEPATTHAELAALVQLFDDPATAYPSEPDCKYAPAFSVYRHLARIAEWQTEDGNE
jgi:ATP-dependent helicase/nuclease subunit B